MKRIFILFTLLFALHFAFAQNKVQQKVPDKTRILFLLDGSGSMNALWKGNQSRIDVAKTILTKLVDSLKVNPKLELALRVYGHRFSRQANNCQDSYLEVPFALNNHRLIIDKIKDIKPKGVTPITYSLLQAAKDFPENATGYRNIIILITDGIESCGGDPCSTSLELQRKGVFLRPFIIGLGMENNESLNCLGKFIDSKDAKTFNDVLNQSIQTTFSTTSVSVLLLNSASQPKETNINVSFVNSMTGTSMYEFVHYLDKNGKPDTVQIDPVLTYDLVVNTLPPVMRKNVAIENGKHNVVSIQVPQGSLLVKPEARGNPFTILVRQKGKSETLNQQKSGEAYRYLQGSYEIETMTLPKRIFEVQIEGDKTKTITLPNTGLLNLNTLTPGYGSIFEILPSGETRWVTNLNDNASQHSYNLLPGSYKISFRARQAGGSKFTAIKTFEIKSGQTTSVSMF